MFVLNSPASELETYIQYRNITGTIMIHRWENWGEARFTSHTPSFLLPPAQILVLVMWRYPLCISLHLSLLTIGRSTTFSTSSCPVPGKVSVFHMKSWDVDDFSTTERSSLEPVKKGSMETGRERRYLWFLPSHTFYIAFPQGWSSRLQAAGRCGRCLRGGQACSHMMKRGNTLINLYPRKDGERMMEEITNTVCQWFSDTHLERRIRAKLEPSGPHITWAMLISCLLKESGESFQISETPSHTRYSLRSGTLQRDHTDSALSQFHPHTHALVYGGRMKQVRGAGSGAVTMRRNTVGRSGPTPLWSASPHTSAWPWGRA